MSFNFNGREILTDSEGYLKNREDWSEDLMNYMAQNDGLELTGEHILIIKAVKEAVSMRNMPLPLP